MKTFLSFSLCLCFLLAHTPALGQRVDDGVSVSPTDWPWWRGPQRNGVAADEQSPPVSWSESQNILWKSPIPGRGHGSPMVFQDAVYLATADHVKKQQMVICFDRATGKQRWQRVVHSGGFDNKNALGANEKASFASSTLATDGQRLFINFFNQDAVHTTALDLDGEILWQHKVCDYVIHQGYGSSPAIYGPLVIVSADNKGGGAVVAFNRETGEVVWQRKRPMMPNYASPIVLSIAGKDQLILTGAELVTSLNPHTGETLWEIEGATTECVTSTVTDGKHIFTSGGYPKNHIAAVVADGSGKVAWETNTRAYVPSMLHKDGFLFATLDAGVATCIRSDTGKEVWKARLGGTFTASPVLVGDLIYATNEDGETTVFKADAKKFQKVATNKLGDHVMATPTFCGNRIFARVASIQDGNRQEYLYCIGE